MYNFVKNAVIAVCIGLLTIPFFCSCQKKDNYDATYGIMSAKEYNTFANRILSIKPDYPLDSSWIRYDDVKKDSDELVEIGYEGLPVLIQIMNEQANNDNYSFFDLSFWFFVVSEGGYRAGVWDLGESSVGAVYGRSACSPTYCTVHFTMPAVGSS